MVRQKLLTIEGRVLLTGCAKRQSLTVSWPAAALLQTVNLGNPARFLLVEQSTGARL